MIIDDVNTTVTTIDEAITKFHSDFRSVPEAHLVSDLKLSPDGLIHNGSSSNITKDALWNLCRLLKIPVRYAQRIPVELLSDNVNKLSREMNTPIVVTRNLNQGYINGIYRDGNQIPSDRLLTAVADKLKGDSNFQSSRISVGDRGVSVQFTDQGLPQVAPTPGDITQIGFDIWNSDTGFGGLVGTYYLLRLVCTNGAVVPTTYGVRKSFDKRIADDPDKIINRFMNQLLSLEALQATALSDTFLNMSNTQLTDVRGVKYWNKVMSIADDQEVANRILHWDHKMKEQVFTQVKTSGATDSPVEQYLPINYYELYNNTTAEAKQHDPSTRRSLERLGGILVHEMKR